MVGAEVAVGTTASRAGTDALGREDEEQLRRTGRDSIGGCDSAASWASETHTDVSAIVSVQPLAGNALASTMAPPNADAIDIVAPDVSEYCVSLK